jgi:hypothetical protein
MAGEGERSLDQAAFRRRLLKLAALESVGSREARSSAIIAKGE